MRNAFRTGERIYFRPVEVEDAPLFQAWLNDPENHQYLLRTTPLNGAEEKRWLETVHEQKNLSLFGIALKEGERLIGNCGLRAGEPAHRSADLGIVVGVRELQGKGYGAEAIGLLLEYGFATLGLHRITLHVYENNLRAIRCYEKCGFRREGVRREARWWAGRWWAILDYAILDHEWHSLLPRNAAT